MYGCFDVSARGDERAGKGAQKAATRAEGARGEGCDGAAAARVRRPALSRTEPNVIAHADVRLRRGVGAQHLVVCAVRAVPVTLSFVAGLLQVHTLFRAGHSSATV